VAAGDAELRERPAEVTLHGANVDEDPVGDLAVRQTGRRESDDLALPFGER
jgi:hypothetical protein